MTDTQQRSIRMRIIGHFDQLQSIIPGIEYEAPTIDLIVQEASTIIHLIGIRSREHSQYAIEKLNECLNYFEKLMQFRVEKQNWDIDTEAIKTSFINEITGYLKDDLIDLCYELITDTGVLEE